MKQIPESGVIPKGISYEKQADQTTYYVRFFGFVVSARVKKNEVRLSYLREEKPQ